MSNFAYNESYLKTYKTYRDIMNTDITIVLAKTPTQSEDPIFQIKALPKTRQFIDETGKEQNMSSIVFFIDELKDLRSLNLDGKVRFPIKDVSNRVKTIRFNGFTFFVESKNINFFNNIIKFDLVSKI